MYVIVGDYMDFLSTGFFLLSHTALHAILFNISYRTVVVLSKPFFVFMAARSESINSALAPQKV